MACLLGACAAQAPVPYAPTARLAAYLIGQYTAPSSTVQSEVTRLRIDPVFLDDWTLRSGLFLFANEQQPNRPWRGQLYHLVPRTDGAVLAEAWRLHPDLVGNDEPLGALEVEALGREAFVRMAGCDLVFQLGLDGIFDGEHERRGACPPTGAPPEDSAYVWTRLRIAPEQMVWFPQYFSAADELLLTPEPSGYRFRQVQR